MEKLSEENHKLFAMLLLTQTIILNKKRKWEIQQLTVEDLASSSSQDDNSGLTLAENILAERYDKLSISSIVLISMI